MPISTPSNAEYSIAVQAHLSAELGGTPEDDRVLAQQARAQLDRGHAGEALTIIASPVRAEKAQSLRNIDLLAVEQRIGRRRREYTKASEIVAKVCDLLNGVTPPPAEISTAINGAISAGGDLQSIFETVFPDTGPIVSMAGGRTNFNNQISNRLMASPVFAMSVAQELTAVLQGAPEDIIDISQLNGELASLVSDKNDLETAKTAKEKEILNAPATPRIDLERDKNRAEAKKKQAEQDLEASRQKLTDFAAYEARLHAEKSKMRAHRGDLTSMMDPTNTANRIGISSTDIDSKAGEYFTLRQSLEADIRNKEAVLNTNSADFDSKNNLLNVKKNELQTIENNIAAKDAEIKAKKTEIAQKKNENKDKLSKFQSKLDNFYVTALKNAIHKGLDQLPSARSEVTSKKEVLQKSIRAKLKTYIRRHYTDSGSRRRSRDLLFHAVRDIVNPHKPDDPHGTHIDSNWIDHFVRNENPRRHLGSFLYLSGLPKSSPADVLSADERNELRNNIDMQKSIEAEATIEIMKLAALYDPKGLKKIITRDQAQRMTDLGSKVPGILQSVLKQDEYAKALSSWSALNKDSKIGKLFSDFSSPSFEAGGRGLFGSLDKDDLYQLILILTMAGIAI